MIKKLPRSCATLGWAGDNEYWSQVAAGDCCSRPVWRGVSGTILTTAAPLLSLNWPPELSTLSTGEHLIVLSSRDSVIVATQAHFYFSVFPSSQSSSAKRVTPQPHHRAIIVRYDSRQQINTKQGVETLDNSQEPVLAINIATVERKNVEVIAKVNVNRSSRDPCHCSSALPISTTINGNWKSEK